jgi:hypothetical protein
MSRNAVAKKMAEEAKARRARMGFLSPTPVAYRPPPAPQMPVAVSEPEPETVEFPEAKTRRIVSISNVLKVAAEHFGIPEHEILSERRTKNLVLVRHAVYWLCKECTLMSYPRIGYWLGRRDHTTILHGVRVMQRRIDAGHEIAPEVLHLRAMLLYRPAPPYWGA